MALYRIQEASWEGMLRKKDQGSKKGFKSFSGRKRMPERVKKGFVPKNVRNEGL